MIFSPYLGGGKTAFMVRKVDSDRANGDDRPVFANFSFTHAEKVAPAEVLLMDRYEEAILMLDELWTVIDSRVSMSGDNDWYNDFVLMTRKRGVDVYGTSQMPNMVDKRFRDIADFKVLCERRGPDRSLDSFIDAYVSTPELRAKQLQVAKRYSFQVREVAGLYDTSEEIERNKRLYVLGAVEKVTKFTLEEPDGTDFKMLDMLVDAKSDTLRKKLLRGYMGIRGSMQDLVLIELQRQKKI